MIFEGLLHTDALSFYEYRAQKFYGKKWVEA